MKPYLVRRRDVAVARVHIAERHARRVLPPILPAVEPNCPVVGQQAVILTIHQVVHTAHRNIARSAGALVLHIWAGTSRTEVDPIAGNTRVHV